MIDENDILIALKELHKRQGTQSALAELAGITQSTISAYLTGKASIKNMPVGVFLNLFRDMEITFFGDKSGDPNIDALRAQLLEIFDTLSVAEKVRLLTIVVANFPDKIKAETKQ